MTETRVEMIRMADTLTDAELDALPVGAILLDTEGRVLRYNRAEASLARLSPGEVIGRNFFSEVAPCTRVREFQGRRPSPQNRLGGGENCSYNSFSGLGFGACGGGPLSPSPSPPRSGRKGRRFARTSADALPSCHAGTAYVG
jgi:photoactive yellow protein